MHAVWVGLVYVGVHVYYAVYNNVYVCLKGVGVGKEVLCGG